METTITGVFASQNEAGRVIDQLVRNGFPRDAIVLITQETPRRHEILGEETADLARGIGIGAAVAGVGGVLAGWSVRSFFEAPFLLAGLIGGLLGALFGAVLGGLIGSATGHQVQQEYETMLAGGSVLVAIDTDRVHARRARRILATAGATALSRSVHRRHRPIQQTG